MTTITRVYLIVLHCYTCSMLQQSKVNSASSFTDKRCPSPYGWGRNHQHRRLEWWKMWNQALHWLVWLGLAAANCGRTLSLYSCFNSSSKISFYVSDLSAAFCFAVHCYASERVSCFDVQKMNSQGEIMHHVCLWLVMVIHQ